MSKHRGRILALQTLYGLSFTSVANEQQLAKLYLSSVNTSTDSEADQAEPAGFAWELTKGAWLHSREIDTLLEKYSRNRPLARVGRMEHTLLSLALYEMLYLKTEAPIIKKETTLLAKEFGLQEARSYIAGVLDAAARDLQPSSISNAD